MLKINAFSYRTGLSPSALRFYDRKGLLFPTRMSNGYRLYSEDQIGTALQIHSLRQADVPLEDIRNYLKASSEDKSAYIETWRKETQTKLLSLQIANRYLTEFTPTTSRTYLMRWEEPKTFLWFRHCVVRQKQPFHDTFPIHKNRIKEMGLVCTPCTYVRLDGRSSAGELRGEVGFEIKPTLEDKAAFNHLKNGSLEVMQPCLFAVIESSADDEWACFSYIHLFKKYGIEPIGPTMERYNESSDVVQLLVPIQS